VPNHSSDEHEWFNKSVHRIYPYTNYYVWLDGKVDENGYRVPPNNWVREIFFTQIIHFISLDSIINYEQEWLIKNTVEAYFIYITEKNKS